VRDKAQAAVVIVNTADGTVTYKLYNEKWTL
jgi:hypothetical protein